MNPEFDYSKLNEKIIRTFLTRTASALSIELHFVRLLGYRHRICR